MSEHIYHLQFATDDDAHRAVGQYATAVEAAGGDIYPCLSFATPGMPSYVVVVLPDGLAPEELAIEGSVYIGTLDEAPVSATEPSNDSAPEEGGD